MTLLHAYQSRNFTRDITILDANSATVTPTANDKVKATIFRIGKTPVFTLESGTDTAAGSTFVKGAPCRLRIDATDLAAIEPGVYTLEVAYYDNADSQEWKVVERQIFSLEET